MAEARLALRAAAASVSGPGVTVESAPGPRAPLRGDQRAHLREQLNQHVRARASYRQIETRERQLDDLIAGRPTKTNRAPCPSCGRRYSGRGPIWTEDRIIAAIREWEAEHGQPPTNREWWFAGEDRPGRVTVMKRFGSWNKAIMAAGFVPRRQGDFRVGAASAGRATVGRSGHRGLTVLRAPHQLTQRRQHDEALADRRLWH